MLPGGGPNKMCTASSKVTEAFPTQTALRGAVESEVIAGFRSCISECEPRIRAGGLALSHRELLRRRCKHKQ